MTKDQADILWKDYDGGFFPDTFTPQEASEYSRNKYKSALRAEIENWPDGYILVDLNKVKQQFIELLDTVTPKQ